MDSLNLQHSCLQRELNIRDQEKSTLENTVDDLRQQLNAQAADYRNKIQALNDFVDS